MDPELKPLKGTFEWNLGNTRAWTWWPLCFHSPCPLCVIPSWLTVFNLGVASESLSSRQVCVTGHGTCLHAGTLHTHAYTYTSHHNWRRSTAGMRDWKNGRQKGKRRTPEEFSSHCDSCLISSLRDYTARKLLKKALKLWAQEKSLADAFLNKMEHRSVARQLYLKWFYSRIKQTALTSV